MYSDHLCLATILYITRDSYIAESSCTPAQWWLVVLSTEPVFTAAVYWPLLSHRQDGEAWFEWIWCRPLVYVPHHEISSYNTYDVRNV